MDENLQRNNVARQVEAFCISYFAAFLKTWLRLPFLVHFRKQQRNISNILIISTSASTSSHLSKSYLCFKGKHSRRNISTHSVSQQSPNLSLNSAKRRHGQAKRFHTWCIKYEFPVLYFRLCRLFVPLLLDGKTNLLFIIRSVIYISLEFLLFCMYKA